MPIRIKQIGLDSCGNPGGGGGGGCGCCTCSGGGTCGGAFTLAFDNSDLVGGILTVNHGLGGQYVDVSVYDNNDEMILPDAVIAVSTTTVDIDLSGFQPLAGGVDQWHVLVLSDVGGGGGGGTPGAPDTSIQFNDGGTFGGDVNFTFNKVDDRVHLTGSLSQGELTLAQGLYSHAEGYLTHAGDDYAHAEGEQTKADGQASHSEGWLTTGSGNYSHAEGQYTLAEGLASHAEGQETNAFASYSHSEGKNTKAGGSWSHSEGQFTTASAPYSHAEGYYSVVDASGGGGHAEGYFTTVFGTFSHAEGFATKAEGAYSHTEGRFTTASAGAMYSHAEGVETNVVGGAAHAEGYKTLAAGLYTHVEGWLTTASAAAGHSHAEGRETLVEADGAHVEGRFTRITSTGIGSHAEGLNTLVTAQYAHAEGYYTTASANYSHAEGYLTRASAVGSHAQGHLTTASAQYSFAGGHRTVADGQYQTVFGKFNVVDSSSNTLFIIGDGTGVSTRSSFLKIESSSVGTVEILDKGWSLADTSNGNENTYHLALKNTMIDHSVQVYTSWGIGVNIDQDLYFSFAVDTTPPTTTLNAKGYINAGSLPAQMNFTGQHRSTPTGQYNDFIDKIGYIVVSTGEYSPISGSQITINDAVPIIEFSTKRNDKKCFGVISDAEDTESTSREFSMGRFVSIYEKQSAEDNRIFVNSLGEGCIWVCNINGNLENGDYITTCEIPGLGMKQDDDSLKNYTVAKITCDCNFDLNSTIYKCEEFIHEGVTYRRAFVGCTYHCG